MWKKVVLQYLGVRRVRQRQRLGTRAGFVASSGASCGATWNSIGFGRPIPEAQTASLGVCGTKAGAQAVSSNVKRVLRDWLILSTYRIGSYTGSIYKPGFGLGAQFFAIKSVLKMSTSMSSIHGPE